MIYLTRKCEFSASHYYHNPEWTDEENRRVFGKCGNLNGHGHNYTLEVTVKGDIDPVTGFVVDLKELKDILNREVVDAMDHRHLNKEVPEFATQDSDHREHCDCHLAAARRQVERARNCIACGSTKCPTCLSISTEKHEGLSYAAVHFFGLASLALPTRCRMSRTAPFTASATTRTGTATTIPWR